MIRATVIFPESHRKLGSQKGISARLIVNIKQVEKEVLLDVSSAVRKYINLLIISKDRRSKSKKHFCSVLCSNIWHGKEFSREKHPNWKGGEFSYKDALKRHDVLKQCVLCGKSDQRILAVHHVDRNRKNNKLENLMWLCHNCHFLVHHYKREGLKIMKS